MVDWEKELYEYCEQEKNKQKELIEREYTDRLNTAINLAVYKPYCIPYVEGGRSKKKEWININSFRLEYGFTFYHHSKSDLLEYAIKNRGNPDVHLYAMRDTDQVNVDEFPAPGKTGKVYMISSNGNHRTLVFYSMGLKYIEANVQKIIDNKWRYYWKNQSPAAATVLTWFKKKGLINNITYIDKDTIIFDGKCNIAGWIMPSSESGSLFRMIREIKKRLKFIKQSFPEVNKEDLVGLDTNPIIAVYLKMCLKL